MRVFKDYKDFLENKNDGENGVSQDFLNQHYNGDIEEAKNNNKSNLNCYNCKNCRYCNNCDYCRYCNDCFNCKNCDDCKISKQKEDIKNE